MLLIVTSFSGAYLTGVFGLIWFDLHVLDLGDPKLKNAVDIYFPLWSMFYSPAVIMAVVFLGRSRQQGWHLWRLAALFLILILAALEVSFVLDLGWGVLLLEIAIFGFLFSKIQRLMGYSRPTRRSASSGVWV